MVNSRLGLFSAAFFRRHPFSLSYGVILPSSLTIVLSLTLGFSPHLPVSVYGTGTIFLDRDFSRQCEISCFAIRLPITRHRYLPDLPRRPDFVLRHTQPTVCSTYPPVSSHFSNRNWWYRNINRLSITYAFRPQLRSRLTLSGRAFLRKPWVFGGCDSHTPLATNASILTPMQSTTPYGIASAHIGSSPTT